MKNEPIVANEVSRWLNEHTLQYAIRNAKGGGKIYLQFEVGTSKWIVLTDSSVLLCGIDIEQAVKIFNENSF